MAKRYIRLLLILILGLLINTEIIAQVKGIIADSTNGKGIDKAIVGLVEKQEPSDTTYTYTDENGVFNFEKVPAGNFSVIITISGFKPTAKYVAISTPQKTVNLGTILLPNLTKVLGEILVESAPITIKEDTVEYRADAFKVKEGALVEDLLKKLPGVQVDKDGNIKAQGKDVKRVLVNGKEFFGGDPKTATRELPADMIDKVQVIDDYGDQANLSGIKDGEAEKVMNFQLKKDKNQGYFGRTTVGGGSHERYLASVNGNYFKNDKQISLFSNSNNTNASLFNFGSGGNRGMGSMMRAGQSMMSDLGGSGSIANAMNSGDAGFLQTGGNNSSGVTSTNSIGFNYRDQWGTKVIAYGSYSYSHRNTQSSNLTSKENIFPRRIISDNRNTTSLTSGDNHRVYMNIEYKIDSFNYLKISPGITYGNNDGNNLTPYFELRSNDTLSQKGNIAELNNSKSPNINATILYNHTFKKRGRNFSANINLGSSENNSESDNRNTTINYLPPFTGTLQQFLLTNQENDNRNIGMRITYSEPLSKIRALDLTYGHNFSYTRNNRDIFTIDPTSGGKTFNPVLSNDYENDFYTDRVSATIRTTAKKYNYTLGLSAQQVNLKGYSISSDSAYKPIRRVNVFPVARFSYKFTKSKSLNVHYNGNAQQPSFTQLQDVTDSSNRQYIRRGNPNLKPSINHNMNITFNDFNFITGRVLFTSLSFSKIQNQIVYNNTILNNGAQSSSPENVKGYYNANAFYTYSKPFKNRKYIVSLNGRFNFNHNINLVNNSKTVGNNYIISNGINLEFNHKEWLELGAGANYNLNSIKYSSENKAINSGFQNQEYSSWVLSSNINLTFPKNWVLKYDFDYTLNNGLSGSVGKNLAIMNASLEKQLFKKRNGILRLQAFDLFNQNTNIYRSVTANSIIDTRSNKLTRYFMLSFTLRLQKFKGQQPQQGNRMMHIRSDG